MLDVLEEGKLARAGCPGHLALTALTQRQTANGPAKTLFGLLLCVCVCVFSFASSQKKESRDVEEKLDKDEGEAKERKVDGSSRQRRDT